MPVVKALFDDNCLQGYAAAMLVGIISPFAIGFAAIGAFSGP